MRNKTWSYLTFCLLLPLVAMVLGGCMPSHRVEYLKSKQIYLLLDDHRDDIGHYIVYELEHMPKHDQLRIELEALRKQSGAVSVKSLGDFDDRYESGYVYLLLVRKVTSQGKKSVTYTYVKTELKQ